MSDIDWWGIYYQDKENSAHFPNEGFQRDGTGRINHYPSKEIACASLGDDRVEYKNAVLYVRSFTEWWNTKSQAKTEQAEKEEVNVKD